MPRLIPNTNAIDWENFEWNFDNIMDKVGNLAGHLIHRELRNYGRYPSLYYYFDQTKALQIRNYWNHMDVMIPFDGITPKGEVGFNPDLKYKIYKGNVKKQNGLIFLEPGESQDISIEPRLVELRYTTMRNKSDNVNLKT